MSHKNILIGCTGSVAAMKLPIIASEFVKRDCNVKVVVTEHAKHFFDSDNLNVELYDDAVEWNSWKDRGDPVLHIDLGKWADLYLIAPLDANTLAKIASGVCDNVVTCVARAWDNTKPLVFCPAMNTRMYQHPVTNINIQTLLDWGYKHIPVIEKTLICGDTGVGAMAETQTIIDYVLQLL